MRPPVNLVTHDASGDFLVRVKKKGMLYGLHYGHHPFDVVGWDGCCYPFAFSIHDFEPITGRVHQPPPVHQTFEANNFVVCSFVPRLYDYHPDAIPAPYNHSNIDSDELLYYVDGDFMSRKNVTRGMITLHPAGIPHGPHPGTVEKSIGKKDTRELAVMVDTFHPLMLTKYAQTLENHDYVMSWAE
jgi:homogentisate 1,2-dioxygenase